jgi:hypothetical protein
MILMYIAEISHLCTEWRLKFPGNSQDYSAVLTIFLIVTVNCKAPAISSKVAARVIQSMLFVKSL